MLDLHTPPALAPTQGVRLAHAAYHQDFRQRDAEIRGRHSWKLERRQHFEELNDPSREALRRGDWDESLRLLEAERPDLLKSGEKDRRHGTVFHRVRVVEEPLTPYIQWELHALRIQAECGRNVRVVAADRVRPLETSGLLPELVVLGGTTMYNVIYTEEGVPDGAVRFTDPDIVRPWESLIQDLHTGGEDITSYVDRVVAPLPPPLLTGE